MVTFIVNAVNSALYQLLVYRVDTVHNCHIRQHLTVYDVTFRPNLKRENFQLNISDQAQHLGLLKTGNNVHVQFYNLLFLIFKSKGFEAEQVLQGVRYCLQDTTKSSGSYTNINTKSAQCFDSNE